MSTPLALFTLRNLALMGDGDLEQDFDATLKGLVLDCLARPAIKKGREMKLVVTISPILNQSGACDDVQVLVQVAAKSPARSVTPYRMRATAKGGLKFAPKSPDDPGQGTFDFGGSQ